MKTAVLLGLLASVWASPSSPPLLPHGALAVRAIDPNACAVVSKAYDDQTKANPKGIPKVPAAAAFACLRTVPNKAEPAQKLVTSVKAYSQWQSTITYLKDPPAGYGLPAVDLMGGFDAIMANVTDAKFESEYDFQVSIAQLISSTHDGHYSFRPDIFKAFGFRNDLVVDLVSASTDGLEAPKIYHRSLLNGTKVTVGNVSMPLGPNGFPPAVTKINGQDAATLMSELGLRFINTQDQDSQWNSLFPNYAQPTTFSPIGGSVFYLGDTVTLEYDNGKKITQDSYASFRKGANFTGVNTGEDFYNKFCNPANAPKKKPAASPAPVPPPGTIQTPTIPIKGFPEKFVVRDSGANVTSGYFLEGAGYEDTAVLSVLGFAPSGATFDITEYIVNFQNIVQEFLAKCQAAGKKKLIIDVSANGGGLVIAGYELYSQIFPGNPIFQANNMRRPESLVTVAEVSGANYDRALALDASALGPNSTQDTRALVQVLTNGIIGNMVPGLVYSAGNKINYTSTKQIISPVELAGDAFTAYQSTPLNASASDFNLTGVGNRANPAPAVFAPENVVILSDGFCGSTCTLFSYLMIMQNSIKTVAVGGRPQLGPMQSMGGVEGAQVFDFEEMNKAATAAMILSPPDNKPANGSDVFVMSEGYLLQRAATPGQAGAVNGKNAFSHSDAKVPLQFLNEPANCRVFYTKEMLFSPEETWKRAADAAFTNPDKFCVSGSQQPVMAVQQPTPEFFTPVATGQSTGVGGNTGNAGGSPSGGNTGAVTASGARGMVASSVAMMCAVAVGGIATLM